MSEKRLKKLIWIVSSTNARDAAFTGFTRREIEDRARSRGYDVVRVETVDEYTARRNKGATTFTF